jgi:prepilin-type N-terminal cleavage/methylation domain-containing protein/prepilin-type processing-associated H-X9-DG protein
MFSKGSCARGGGWRSGLTLVELLAVIAIVGLLVGLLLPAVQSAREAARRSDCQNRMRQLAAGVLHYEAGMGMFPVGGLVWSGTPSSVAGWPYQTPVAGSSSWAWQYFVLPYMEQLKLYEDGAIQPNESPASAQRGGRIRTRSTAYLRCPSDGVRTDNYDSNPSASNYAGSSGPQRPQHAAYPGCTAPWQAGYANRPDLGYTSSNPNGQIPNRLAEIRGLFACAVTGSSSPEGSIRIPAAAVRDGLSNTLLLGETVVGENRYWHYAASAFTVYSCANVITTTIGLNLSTPYNYPDSGGRMSPPPCATRGDYLYGNWGMSPGFKSKHPGGLNFAFGDGAIRFVAETINHDTLQLLGCRHDGRPVSPDNP